MGRLIKPSEYAKECGISRQAVYAKIKRGLLKAKKIDGQIFIELDKSVNIDSNKTDNSDSMQKDILKAKDETISILKDTIKDLKETNNLIVGTLKSEVDLLKEAFGEMQQLYRTQIEHLKVKGSKNLDFEKDTYIDINSYIELNELAKNLKLSKRDKSKFIKAAKKLQNSGDFRFIEIDNELYALKSASYDDFLEAFKR